MKTMDPTKMIQQMIDFQKTVFENSYNAIIMMQSQTEKMAESLLSKNSILPEEGQKMINEWILAVKKSREDFKKSVDENFAKMEEYFVSATKTAKSAAKNEK
ncbi:MAG: hypothetical protein RBR53_01530 [Desulforegulaceae bacterium]|nr:hypothetical protein [Desulforegulaceae bacterium]